MNIQKRVEDLSRNWIYYFLNAYRFAMPYLIESFIEFYGEEHRDYITETIKSIKFNFMLNEYSLQPIKYPDFIREDINLLCLYFALLDEYIAQLKTSELNKEELYIKSCVSTSDSYQYLYPKYCEMIQNGYYALAFVDYQNNERINGIILPILTLGNIDLIHEINHIICTHIIAMDDNEPVLVEPFKSFAVIELINQLTALKITEIFEQKKCPLLPEVKTDCSYNRKLHLVREFYNRFESIIKKVLVTGDTNLLEATLGIDNLERFYDLVENEYEKGIILPLKSKKIESINNKMLSHLEKQHPINYNEFFSELESMGYRVRRL